MKTRNKVLSLTLASALLTTSAFSQVTVSGYVETSIFSGDTKGLTNPTVATKSIGNESVIRLAGTGKMPTGQNAGFYIQVDSDNTGIIHERGLDVGIVNDLTFQYGFDRAFGSEIARTLTPYATNRIQDVSATTATSEFQDVTSGEHAVGITFNNFAALKKTSGSGFALVTSFPSTMTSNMCKILTFSSIGRAFLLAEPNAINCFFSLINSKILTTPGRISDSSMFSI